MIIAIDASRALHPKPTGIEIYSREIIAALLALPQSKDHEWILLTPRLPSPDDPLFTLPTFARWEVVQGRYAWTLYHLSQYFRNNEKNNYTLFVPAHVLPLVTPKHTVITVHDLAYRYYPKNYGLLGAWQMDREISRSIAKADQLICPSIATSNDVTKFYRVQPDKISIAPHGIDHRTLKGVKATDVKLPKQPYFLSIGRIEQRKNTLRLAESYNTAWQKSANLPELYHIGRPGHNGNKIQQQIMRLPAAQAGKIHFLGYLPQSITDKWRKHALAFLFPSLYEGFGLPVLEAMADGVPTLTSTISSLPEAASDAGLLVDPVNNQAISDAILRLATDSTLRTSLINRGKNHARKFTWQAAAEKTFEAILKASK